MWITQPNRFSGSGSGSGSFPNSEVFRELERDCDEEAPSRLIGSTTTAINPTERGFWRGHKRLALREALLPSKAEEGVMRSQEPLPFPDNSGNSFPALSSLPSAQLTIG